VGPAQLEAFAGDESIEDALGVEDQIDRNRPVRTAG
jgi:hypothetical protein